jgi:hypothetical protein
MGLWFAIGHFALHGWDLKESKQNRSMTQDFLKRMRSTSIFPIKAQPQSRSELIHLPEKPVAVAKSNAP